MPKTPIFNSTRISVPDLPTNVRFYAHPTGNITLSADWVLSDADLLVGIDLSLSGTRETVAATLRLLLEALDGEAIPA